MRQLTRTLASLVLATAVASAYAFPPDPTVYIVEKGKKYHKENCTLKHGSKGVKLSFAKKNGYTACKVCKPPA